MRRSCRGGGECTSAVASGGVTGGIHSPWIRPVTWETCYCLFRTWQRDGTWAHTLTKLQAARTRRA